MTEHNLVEDQCRTIRVMIDVLDTLPYRPYTSHLTEIIKSLSQYFEPYLTSYYMFPLKIRRHFQE